MSNDEMKTATAGSQQGDEPRGGETDTGKDSETFTQEDGGASKDATMPAAGESGDLKAIGIDVPRIVIIEPSENGEGDDDSSETDAKDGNSDFSRDLASPNADAPIEAVVVVGHGEINVESSTDKKPGITPDIVVSAPDPSGPTWEAKRLMKQLKAEVKLLNYENYMNRYGKEEGYEIIEVLRGHPKLQDEIARELLRRQTKERERERVSQKDIDDKETKATKRHWKNVKSKIAAHDRALMASTNLGETWLQNVRIQSPALIQLLVRLTGTKPPQVATTPVESSTPFPTLHYYLPQMKECLSMLEKRWGSHGNEGVDSGLKQVLGGDSAVQGPPGSQEHQTIVSDPNPEESDDELQEDEDLDLGKQSRRQLPREALKGPLSDSRLALQHLRTYVKFVEEKIEPMWQRAATDRQRNVRFDELAMIFQPGELLCDRLPLATGREAKFKDAWMLCGMSLDGSGDPAGSTPPRPKGEMWIYAYRIEYDGASYGPIQQRFIIRRYEGKKDVTELDIFPIKFLEDADAAKESLHNRGQMFLNAIKDKHFYYDGWTLGHKLHYATNESAMNSQHIDGHVIVDFSEGFRSSTDLGVPGFSTLIADKKHEGLELVPDSRSTNVIKRWVKSTDSEGQTSLAESVTPLIVVIRPFSHYLKDQLQAYSKFVRDWTKFSAVSELEGNDIALLPRRVVAYALRERKFVNLDVDLLEEIGEPRDVFGDLKINEVHKMMVKSLVKRHFEKADIIKQHQRSVGLNHDLIRGKGSGLFILLHGVPGVGKTATAEAIAQYNKKPLFSITCGDLGFTPREVETSLGEIFRLAHLWDCVLLLDEADVFLARREVSDLKRNALVSVFLRVLEYYSGVLFLTTNRVGSLDEAFKSRIHLSLYYPPLDKVQTLAIFDLNIRRLYELEEEKDRLKLSSSNPSASGHRALQIDEESILRYAEWYFDSRKPTQRWNGRQIRNAFQIAYSLAHFDMKKTSSTSWKDVTTETNNELVLDDKHFDIVAEAVEHFDFYLSKTTPFDDRKNAHILGLRNDNHDPGMMRRTSYREMPQAPLTQRPPRTPNPTPQETGWNASQSQRSGPGYQPPRGTYQPPRQRYGSDAPQERPGPGPQPRPQARENMAHFQPRLATPQSPGPASSRFRPPMGKQPEQDHGYASGWSTSSRTPDYGYDAAPEEEFLQEQDGALEQQHYGHDEYYVHRGGEYGPYE